MEIIPLGQGCNISWLLQNVKIKKQTTLFEWFFISHLNSITNILKLIILKDNNIITYKEGNIYINNDIRSSHYNEIEFKDIYKRRKDRLLELLKSTKKIIFYRFEQNNNEYTNEDINDFKNVILLINPLLEFKLILITTKYLNINNDILINKIYNDFEDDLYYEKEKVKEFFKDTLREVGYDLEENNKIFTDKSLE